MFWLTSPTAVVCTSVLFSAKHQIARGQKLLPGYSITSLQARLLSAGWSYFNTPTLLKPGSSHAICRLKSKRQFALPMLWSIEFLHSAQALLFLQQYKAVLARAPLSFTPCKLSSLTVNLLFGDESLSSIRPCLFNYHQSSAILPPQQLSLPQPFILVSVPPPSSC